MRAVVLTSGGIKSMLALDQTVKTGHFNDVIALYVNYGQQNNREERASHDITKWCIEHGSPRLHRIHTDVSHLYNWNDQEYLYPGLTTLLVTCGLTIALSLQASKVVLGNCLYDNHGELELVDALRRTVYMGSNKLVKLELPNSALRYEEAIVLARTTGLPLDLTWSCTRSQQSECGSCEACTAKRIAAAYSRGI